MAHLYEFSSQELPAIFHGKDEVQCGGCLYLTDRMFVISETRQQALEAITRVGLGLCGNCIAELVAEKGWSISRDEP
jgi:hypothetical protein